MAMPPLDEIPGTIQASAKEAESIFKTNQESIRVEVSRFLTSWACSTDGVYARAEPLMHYLSDAWQERTNGGRAVRLRYVIESAAYREFVNADLSIMQSPKELISLLCRLSSAVGGPGQVREINVGTMRDRQGGQVVFPDVRLISERVRELSIFFSKYWMSKPLIFATVMMNGVANIHPFLDGNGRVSRVLFNLLLNTSLRTNCYIPIYELSELSRGGFLIRLRDAQYNGNWGPLIEYVSYIVGSFWVRSPGLVDE